MTFETLDRLDGKVAVITGGAGAIGLATAKRLAARGCRIVSLDRNATPEGRADVAAKLAALPVGSAGAHLGLVADITDSASLKAAAAAVQAQAGRCDILVNSAGFTRAIAAADLDGLTDELFDAILTANLRGVFATIRAFMPLLQASGDGLVVTVSSIAGFTGNGSNLAYVAAKAGVDILTEALAKAFAPQVRLLCVSPGVVASGFVPGRGADFNDKAGAATPLKRVGLPDDTAAAIEACATTLRFATGTRFVIDGGRSL
jgi:NAD(P)-dependent dehydrogenase (short-subunit alcohol dehydrogenase family)